MKFVQFITTALAATSISATTALAEAPASFATCTACHQATGLGLPGVFPPLAGSEWVNGPVDNLIRIQLRGLMGPIKVGGKDFNSVMPPNSAMTDEQIAEVLTYIRSEWGNKASAVTPDMVKALRSEVGKPMLTVADLKDPNAKEEPKKEEPAAPAPAPAPAPEPAPAAPKAAPKATALKAPESFVTCVACHQATGLGLPGAFPPLAGSEWVSGPVENLIRIQLRGLSGPISVAGKEYNSMMPANASMTDDQIAEVLTYVRAKWGNNASAVTPDMVKALRSEEGKPVLTVKDLIDPNQGAAVSNELKSGAFKDTEEVDSGLPIWVYGFMGLCLVPVAIGVVSKK